jgi:hypothetical protein
MRCYDARKKLSALLDGALEGELESAVLGHVEGCGHCRAELEAFLRSDRVVREVVAARVQFAAPAGYFDGFAARVAARLGPDARADDLADIRALAAKTLERHAVRPAPEPTDALLTAAAPVSLGQVVLPPAQPTKKRPIRPLLFGATLAAAAAAVWLLLPRPQAPVRAPEPRAIPIPQPIPQPIASPSPSPPPPPSPSPPPPPSPQPSSARPQPMAPAPAKAAAAPEKSAEEILGQLTEPAKPTEPPSTGRAKLSHEEIMAGMTAVEGRVKACFTRYQVPGQVVLRVKILPTGGVAVAEPIERFAATETGSCAAEAVERAVFAAFDGPAMTIRYSFTLGEE